jgi:hypothetical protein
VSVIAGFNSDPSSSFYNPYAMRSRIMYIESKAEGLNGPARIGRVREKREAPRPPKCS